MRIGVDARKLRDGGIGTYIRNLLGVFVGRPEGHEFVVFLQEEDLGSMAYPGSRAEEVRVRAGKYSVSEHWLLARAARRARVDLYHSPHYTLPLPIHCPAVVTVHDLIHVRFARFFPAGAGIYARTIAGAAVRKARLVLVDSAHVRDDVQEFLGVSSDRVRVVPLGISREFTRRSGQETERFLRDRSLPSAYFLYVGARKKHKNVALLIDALEKLPRSDRLPLVLSGPAWKLGHPLAQRALRAGVTSCIHFSGPLTRDEDLAHLYSGAALYVQPSLDEGFGLPPLEAMACGTPVLSSSAGALRETLGDAAVLLPPSEPEIWAETMTELLQNSVRREELIRRGLARARSYTWERTAELTMRAYGEALDA
ncbi:MAG TPA: glycosyltransferase family 1 protein [Candidatus Polarisedimenticolia bacterium]|nr:glycosyltransferase family 1 protein [Candidatus Polarisedimenticolia bacterium]